MARNGKWTITRHLVRNGNESVRLHTGDGKWYLLEDGVPVSSQYDPFDEWRDGSEIRWIEDPELH